MGRKSVWVLQDATDEEVLGVSGGPLALMKVAESVESEPLSWGREGADGFAGTAPGGERRWFVRPVPWEGAQTVASV